MTHDISRRSLIKSASMVLAGFSLPTLAPPKADRAVLWIVALAGNNRTPQGFEAFEVGQKSARAAGYTVLDSMHHVRERSRFLARKEVSLKYAREQERLSTHVKAHPFKNSDLQDIAEGLIALWVEVA